MGGKQLSLRRLSRIAGVSVALSQTQMHVLEHRQRDVNKNMDMNLPVGRMETRTEVGESHRYR